MHAHAQTSNNCSQRAKIQTRGKGLYQELCVVNMFAVGKEFSSFDELKDAIDKYQLSTYSQFYVRDSRTIAATAKRAPKRRIKEDLKYGYLVYSCIAGGKKFQSKSTGSRPNQR